MTTPTFAASVGEQHQDTEQRSWVEMVMGLPISVTVRGPEARGALADQVVAGVYGELRHADRVFSTYRADSEISLLRSGALAPEFASTDVRDVLELCAQARALTGGDFDAEITQIDGHRELDPSALVKGWAVEHAASGLDQLDGHDWLANAGGDILARATYGPAWRIAIEDPRDRSQVLCVLDVQAGAVATCGTAARGRHITDPRTGRPAPDHLLSATVTGPSLTWSDVLATAAFVEGPGSLDRIAALDGYESVMLLPDGQLLGSAGAAGLLSEAQ